jgi:hypothetical protein
MAHISGLSPFIKFELLISTILIMILLIVGISKKEKILSDTAISRVKAKWFEFKVAFYLGLLGLIFFLMLLLTEIIEVEREVVIRSSFSGGTDLLILTILLCMILVNGLGLHIVFFLTGGGE